MYVINSLRKLNWMFGGQNDQELNWDIWRPEWWQIVNSENEWGGCGQASRALKLLPTKMIPMLLNHNCPGETRVNLWKLADLPSGKLKLETCKWLPEMKYFDIQCFTFPRTALLQNTLILPCCACSLMGVWTSVVSDTKWVWCGAMSYMKMASGQSLLFLKFCMAHSCWRNGSTLN